MDEFEMKLAVDQLSRGATCVLAALLESSGDTGDDFGFMDEARESMTPQISTQKFAGYVSGLQPFIEASDDLSLDPGVDCDSIQFTLTEATIDARMYIAKLARLRALPADGEDDLYCDAMAAAEFESMAY
tara:strand:+ start:736 stop:1125 length:390 start_codon:yes stop_codon:yes gene_type:complete